MSSRKTNKLKGKNGAEILAKTWGKCIFPTEAATNERPELGNKPHLEQQVGNKCAESERWRVLGEVGQEGRVAGRSLGCLIWGQLHSCLGKLPARMLSALKSTVSWSLSRRKLDS